MSLDLKRSLNRAVSVHGIAQRADFFAAEAGLNTRQQVCSGQTCIRQWVDRYVAIRLTFIRTMNRYVNN
ncbi:hypothetical protein D3C76_1633650 [compost metagenome]